MHPVGGKQSYNQNKHNTEMNVKINHFIELKTQQNTLTNEYQLDFKNYALELKKAENKILADIENAVASISSMADKSKIPNSLKDTDIYAFAKAMENLYSPDEQLHDLGKDLRVAVDQNSLTATGIALGRFVAYKRENCL